MNGESERSLEEEQKRASQGRGTLKALFLPYRVTVRAKTHLSRFFLLIPASFGFSPLRLAIQPVLRHGFRPLHKCFHIESQKRIQLA